MKNDIFPGFLMAVFQLFPQRDVQVDLDDLPSDRIVSEGYIAKKGFGKMWVGDRPVRGWEK